MRAERVKRRTRSTPVDPAIAAERRTWKSCVPMAHGHALMVASNLHRRGSHCTVVETSQSYNTTAIGVGGDALGWPNKILRWVLSIETWRRSKIARKSVRALPADALEMRWASH
jgi:hypothetical protein